MRRQQQNSAWPHVRGTLLITLLLWICITNAAAQQSQNQNPSPSQSPQEQPSNPTERGTEVGSESPAADDEVETMFPHLSNTRYWLSGQANFIFQAHPDFQAKYSGPHSLSSDSDNALSRVLTLYTGLRLNNSTEVLFDLEEAGGSALSTGLGLAGFTNLDIVRNPLLSKAPYPARAMIHKIIALSKDKIENQRNALSLFDELPRRRLEVRFGKFGMADFVDVNSVGSDSRMQFMNWTVDNNGAWDYAADTRGYTVGAIVDYEDRNWGIRFGEGLMPKVANGIDLVWRPWQVHAENWEYELRRGLIPRKPGVVRALAYTNYANMGIYRQSIAQYEQHLVPTPEITNHAWNITRKYGFGINVEQNLTANLTAFGRFGWDNGKTESFAYTEVDQTFEGGLGSHGAMWHRRQDRAGVAIVTNGIAKDHQIYLADGGLGFLLGDGALRYGREDIIEAYYTAHIWRGVYVAPDLQHINNPGYNRDRGPVLVGSFRLHVEF